MVARNITALTSYNYNNASLVRVATHLIMFIPKGPPWAPRREVTCCFCTGVRLSVRLSVCPPVCVQPFLCTNLEKMQMSQI